MQTDFRSVMMILNTLVNCRTITFQPHEIKFIDSLVVKCFWCIDLNTAEKKKLSQMYQAVRECESISIFDVKKSN